jgi:ketosteroid isomerase-like protein
VVHTTETTSPVVSCGRHGGRVAEDVTRTKEEGEEHGDTEQSKAQVHHKGDLAMSSEHHRAEQSRKAVEVTEQEANAA